MKNRNEKKTHCHLPGIHLFTALICVITCSHAQISARITASRSQLTDACGTDHVKAVFVCQGALCFVDFSESTPQIRQIDLADPAYLPVISPDGGWIAFQTGIDAEGVSTSPITATSWIRELAVSGTPVKIADTAYVPRFVQNTPPDTPEVIYSTSVSCPDLLCYADGQTLKKRIINNVPGPAEAVCENGSWYGGLSWDNRYLNTAWGGGTDAFMLDLEDGDGTARQVHNMRVKKNDTEIDTFVTVGACNPSRSASRIFTDAMLYCDFSSSAITAAMCFHPILGRWPNHELLFISRYDGEDLRFYSTPAERTLEPIATAEGFGEAVGRQWNNPEWSNHPYYAAAGLFIDRLWNAGGSWNHTYKNESIYLVDLKDSLYIKLIESTDTSYTSTVSFDNPYIWVEVPDGFQEDAEWLSQTIWERAGYEGVIEPGAYFRKSRTSSPIAEISVYTFTGRKVAGMSGAQNPSVFMKDGLNGLKSGIYLVVSKSRNGRRNIYKWTKVR